MKVYYCDCCGNPIHGKRYWVITTDEGDVAKRAGRGQALPEDIESKEICETCKRVIDQLFLNKKKIFADVVSELRRLYELTQERGSDGCSKEEKST